MFKRNKQAQEFKTFSEFATSIRTEMADLNNDLVAKHVRFTDEDGDQLAIPFIAYSNVELGAITIISTMMAQGIKDPEYIIDKTMQMVIDAASAALEKTTGVSVESHSTVREAAEQHPADKEMH